MRRRAAGTCRLTSIGCGDQIDDNLATNPAEKMLDRPGDHRDDRENQSLGQGVSRIYNHINNSNQLSISATIPQPRFLFLRALSKALPSNRFRFGINLLYRSKVTF